MNLRGALPGAEEATKMAMQLAAEGKGPVVIAPTVPTGSVTVPYAQSNPDKGPELGYRASRTQRPPP